MSVYRNLLVLLVAVAVVGCNRLPDDGVRFTEVTQSQPITIEDFSELRFTDKDGNEIAYFIAKDADGQVVGYAMEHIGGGFADKIKLLIAVGAMHLPGERGLLRLLLNRGYRLKAVY